ncbi:hypothetical protein Q361_1113 [Flavobacterium croceum DSM 17960]|uniref:PH (Pleckstrin Homology) domain-containing protein n=1 Tax=Flavobacterium croceum DSM 17960 TaxID=1121886 RepID=A0A2S4N6E9_9FLAO|nr:hypothetical protein [Flavobacterium croceum]POS01292.1 hypothetical protein Q361_1113 [Flavobacterium croceum DSM 17960]
MVLKSKSYLSTILFGFFGCTFAILWIIIFTNFIIIGNNFRVANLILIPILIIPSWMLFIIQEFLDRLKFSKDEIIVYKILIYKFKKIDWKSLDYCFNTIERGKSGSFKVLYLVKNKRLVLRISESNYKNYNDINKCISSNIKNKGFIELNFFESFKYYTKGKILKLL